MARNGSTVYIIVACHFASKENLCAATRQRILRGIVKASRESYPENWRESRFVATGDVPYEKGGVTLAQLIKKELVKQEIKPENVLIGDGVGSFSESGSVPKQIQKRWPGTKKISVISHHWYFWPASRLWRESSNWFGMEVEISKVRGAGGFRTLATYAVLGSLVWAADLADRILCPLFRASALYFLGKLLTKVQAGRKNGFKLNGCG